MQTFYKEAKRTEENIAAKASDILSLCKAHTFFFFLLHILVYIPTSYVEVKANVVHSDPHASMDKCEIVTPFDCFLNSFDSNRKQQKA